MKVKINTLQLFSGRSDVRKFLSVGIRDEDRAYIEEQWDLTEHEIDEVLNFARMYVQMVKLPETLEVEVEG